MALKIIRREALYYPFEDTTGTFHDWGVPQLDQETLSASLRVDYTLSPLISFQSFIQPFIWQGIYSDFKKFTTYEKYEFQRYYMEDEISNYSALVFNSVFRWKFSPGSTFYLVWTSNSELAQGGEEKIYLKLLQDFCKKLQITTLL